MRLPIRFAVLAAMAAAAPAQSLEEVLARMDAAAREFKAFSANVKWIDYTSVLSETSERVGSVRAHKKNGVFGIIEFGEPDRSIKRFGGRTFETYYPKANTLEVIDVGKRAGAVEQFLLLGFALPSSEIRKAYTVTLEGTEQIGAVRATRLDLVPKGSETRNLIDKIQLWIPEGRGNPIQEKVIKRSKDYTLIVYSDPKINPPLPDSAFELKPPPNVRRINPQK